MPEMKSLKLPGVDEAFEVVDEKARGRIGVLEQEKGEYALKTELPAVPVQSVNGKTGAVKLTAEDVGAVAEEDFAGLIPHESWTFTLSDGSTVTKKVAVV